MIPPAGFVRDPRGKQIRLHLPLAARGHPHERAERGACVAEGLAVAGSSGQSERHATAAAARNEMFWGPVASAPLGLCRRWQARDDARLLALPEPRDGSAVADARRYTVAVRAARPVTATARFGHVECALGAERQPAGLSRPCMTTVGCASAAPVSMSMPTPLPLRLATCRCVVSSWILRSPRGGRPGRPRSAICAGRHGHAHWPPGTGGHHHRGQSRVSVHRHATR